MEKVVKINLLNIIKRSLEYIKEADQLSLRELSEKAIKNAEVYQDEDSTTMAVIMYSLSKIIQANQCDVDRKTCNISPQIKEIQYQLSVSYKVLEKNNFREFNKSKKKILDIIGKSDKKLNMYIEEVLSRAQIKKGGSVYSSGISLGQSAQILGITNWQLMNYVGKSEIITPEDESVSIRSRLRFTRSLFQ